MGGKMPAAYYRRYRASHPGYRERAERKRRQRRRSLGREDRSTEYKRRAEKERFKRAHDNGDHGWLLRSRIICRARVLARRFVRMDTRDHYHDDRYEDVVGEIVLALIEGRDHRRAAMVWLKRENLIRWRTKTLEDWDGPNSPD